MAMVFGRFNISSLRSSRFFLGFLNPLPPSKLPPDRILHAFSLVSLCRRGFLPRASPVYPTPSCSILSDDHQRNLHHDTHKLSTLNLGALKSHLLTLGEDCVSLKHFVEVCTQQGIASSNSEAKKLAIKLDQSRSLLLFRNYVYLRPDKIAHELLMALPSCISPIEDDPRQEEFDRLQKERVEIDQIARLQARRLVWTAFGGFTLQSLVFLRLTFWDLSWDVMEPVTFFTTSSISLVGLFFFLVTSREPSYKGIMHTILSSRTRKVMKKRNFDTARFRELQTLCYPYAPNPKIEDDL